jgi:hypothetical protein
VTEGGAVGSAAQGACVTVDGGCSVDLVSQNYRPADGRVTVLAFVQGVENFVDMNGDGQYSCAGFTGPAGSYRPLVDACPSGGEPFTDMPDPFLDTNLNGVYEVRRPRPAVPVQQQHLQGDRQWRLGPELPARLDIEIVFSGSYREAEPGLYNGSCARRRPTTAAPRSAAGLAQLLRAASLSVRLTDSNNNPLPFGTDLSVLSPTLVTVTGLVPGEDSIDTAARRHCPPDDGDAGRAMRAWRFHSPDQDATG